MTPTTKSQEVDSALRLLASARTIGARVDILQKHESDLLKKVMDYAYNPYVKFGIKLARNQEFSLLSVAQRTGGLDLDEPDIWATLDLFKGSTASAMTKMANLESLFKRLHYTTAQIVIGILNKSVVKNVSASTVNKAWPNTIPVFSVQLAQKYTDRKIKSYPQYAEIKYDGVRATSIIYPSGDVEVLTRTGRPIPAAAYFHQELRQVGKSYAAVVDAPVGRKYEGCVTDGELTGDTFNDAVSIFRSDATATTGNYQLFDILPMAALTDKAYVSDDFKVRRETLKAVLDHANAEAARTFAPMDKVLRSQSYLVNSKEETWTMYYEARKNNLEGLIIKAPEGKWQRKRSNDWLKIKAQETLDLRVIGAFEGEGEKEGTLGGLIVDYNGVDVRVGSGYTDAVSDQLWAMFLRDLARRDAGDDDYELLGFLAEVQYQEVTPAGSLRHPVFIRMRRDKDEVSF